MAAYDTVEYYLVADGEFFRVDWEGPNPSFVMLAPLHEVFEGVGAMAADMEAAWPGEIGTPFFLVEAGEAASVAAVLADFDWDSFVTPGRIRDVLGVSDESADALVDLVLREAARVTDLTRLASTESCSLLCVVY